MGIICIACAVTLAPSELQRFVLIMGVYNLYRYYECTYGTPVIVPFLVRQNRRIEGYEPSVFRNKFRFHKDHAYALFNCLGFRNNEDVICENRSRCNSEEAFLIMLARMKSYERFTDMQEHFGIEYSQLSRIFNRVVELVLQRNHHLIFDNVAYFEPRFEMYNAAIRAKLGAGRLPAAANDTALFLDGKSLRISRPSGPNIRQAQVYNGHHRVHSLQFQGVSAPDGMIVDFFGPLPGREHDQTVYNQSEINERLAACQEGNMFQYKTYADKGYVSSSHGNVAYRAGRGLPLPDELAEANNMMSPQRIGVEWSFQKISQNSALIDQYKIQKIQLSQVASFYYVAAILANAHTCLYMSNASVYWNLAPPTLGNYFNMPEYDFVPVDF